MYIFTAGHAKKKKTQGTGKKKGHKHETKRSFSFPFFFVNGAGMGGRVGRGEDLYTLCHQGRFVNW